MDVCFQAANHGRVFPFLRDLHVFHQTEAVKPGEFIYIFLLPNPRTSQLEIRMKIRSQQGGVLGVTTSTAKSKGTPNKHHPEAHFTNPKNQRFWLLKKFQKPEVVEECVAKLEQLRAKVPADLVEEVHRLESAEDGCGT